MPKRQTVLGLTSMDYVLFVSIINPYTIFCFTASISLPTCTLNLHILASLFQQQRKFFFEHHPLHACKQSMQGSVTGAQEMWPTIFCGFFWEISQNFQNRRHILQNYQNKDLFPPHVVDGYDTEISISSCITEAYLWHSQEVPIYIVKT